MKKSPFRLTPYQVQFLLVVGFVTVGYALYLRYLAVELSTVALACDAGLQTMLCKSRTLATYLFKNSVFGIVALIIATHHVKRPSNVLFYATSNRRHLLPRDMMENERSTAINPGEAVEEKVSLSDRFGLWLGFHRCSQDDYLAMVFGYAERFGLEIDPDKLQAESLEWATTRGARSGRTAWQYIQDLAGRLGKRTE